VTVSELDGHALLSVEDEGPGVHALDREHAFERFWRARPDGRGSGLGLSIVRATAERHGGRAFVEGARFTIELPSVRKPSEPDG
jgi:signal transduction histidine kinase